MFRGFNYIDDREKVWELLKEITEVYENTNGWKLPEEEKFKDLTSYIRFFSIDIKNIEAKFKFSQNKSKEDIESVIRSLEKNNQTKVANFMQKIIEQTKQ